MIAADDYGLKVEVRTADEVIKHYFPKSAYYKDTKWGVLVLEETSAKIVAGSKYIVDGKQYKGTYAGKYEDMLKAYQKKKKMVQISLF